MHRGPHRDRKKNRNSPPRGSKTLSGERSERSRSELHDELKELDNRLKENYSKLRLQEMERLVVQLRERVRNSPAQAKWKQRMEEWTDRVQFYENQQESAKQMARLLPREEAVMFKGDNAKAFWTHFKSSIFSNIELSDRQKMSHLMSRVKDHKEAALMVAGFASDGSQLDACLTAFGTRYLDPRVLRADALKKAREVRPITDFRDVVKVTEFIGNLRIINGILTDHILPTDREYIEVIRELLSKLPPEQARRFYPRHHQEMERNPDLTLAESLLQFVQLNDAAASWERYICPTEKRERRTEHGSYKREHRNDHGNFKRQTRDTAKVLTITEGQCSLCRSKEHVTPECTSLPIDEVFQALGKAKICFRCANHTYKRGEPCPKPPSCTRCKGEHARAVCGSRKYPFPQTTTCATTANQITRRTYLCALQAQAVSGDKVIPVRLLLDNCSETSLISAKLTSALGARTQVVSPLWLSGVTDGHTRSDQLATLNLRSNDGTFETTVKAFVTPAIVMTRIAVPSQHARGLAKEKGIPLHAIPTTEGTIDLLIGEDQLVPLLMEGLQSLETHLCAVQTRLGWTIIGRESRNEQKALVCAIGTVDSNDDTTCHLCRDLNKVLDVMTLEDDSVLSAKEAAELEITYDTDSKRYTVRLPKRMQAPPKDNFHNAIQRLVKLRKKLVSEERYVEYDQAIQEYVRQGYAEKVTDGSRRLGTHVIPHRAVFKDDAAKSKCRIVFDARDLNQCLSKGESINADSWSVLMHFRRAPIALMTDLKKAFSQIQVHSDDRDLLRYLWYEHPDDQQPTMYRMSSVTFGLTSSPYLLGAVLQHHTKTFETKFPLVASQMARAAYVDDCIFAAEDREQARAIVEEARQFFAEASFELHPWVTNDPEILFNSTTSASNCQVGTATCILPMEGEQTPGDSEKGAETRHKVLGIHWDTTSDTIQVKPVRGETLKPTKRGVVSVLSQFYDPHSWFAPMKTRARQFLRSLAGNGLDWNEKVSTAELEQARRTIEEMCLISDHLIPRKISADCRELHVFCDASQQAFGAVAYLVNPDTDERMLIEAKVKLAPKRLAYLDPQKDALATTIPRLELMAAVEGAKLADRLLKVLPFDTPCAFYSDSTVTVHRLNKDPNAHEAFEMRRLQLILEKSTKEQWHHVPTDANPADLLTRDIDVQQWLDSKLWWHGPDTTVYPLARAISRQPIACLITLRDDERALLAEGLETALKHLMDNTTPAELEEANVGKTRTLDLTGYARAKLWRLVQTELFQEEVTRIKQGLPVPKRSRLSMLWPFLDEWHVLRHRRLAQPAGLEWETCHPIILGPHVVVQEMLQQEHARLAHSGERELWNHMAEYHHLVRGRRMIKQLIRRCEKCNIQRGKPFSPPEPTLPAFRIEAAPIAFRCIGIDYLGPLKTKGKTNFYALLGTCSVTRAVHLELTTSLDAKQGLNALQRMFARRGVPREVHSDNAKTFVALKRTIEQICNDKEPTTTGDIAIRTIKWIFQAPRAPWWGGFFERLVGVVKNRLQQTEISHTGTPDEIRTILCQVEAMLNSRPLVEAQTCGLPALTPAHFITGESLLTLPPIPSTIESGARGSLLAEYGRREATRAELEKRLYKDYIRVLQRHHYRKPPTREPRLHERVLVEGEENRQSDRFSWPIARIEELIPSQGKAIRMVKISMRGRPYLRAVQRLIPLEGHEEADNLLPPEDVVNQMSPLSSTETTLMDEDVSTRQDDTISAELEL